MSVKLSVYLSVSVTVRVSVTVNVSVDECELFSELFSSYNPPTAAPNTLRGVRADSEAYAKEHGTTYAGGLR